MEKVSVILPAFNEEGNISVLIEKVNQAFTENNMDGEAILINDGSTDNTGQISEKIAERYPFLKVFHHKKNMGLTKALSNGFRRASGDIIFFLCADLQSDPVEDIPKLLKGIKEGADVVVGWRKGRKEFKRFGSKAYNWVSKILFGVTVHDQNWIKAFRKEFVKNLMLRSDWHRFLVAIAVNKGYKVVEVKTNWYPRTYGESKYGFMRIPIAILDMLVLKIEMMFLENPMRFFGTLGLFFGLFGIGIQVVLFVLKNFSGILLTEYTRLKYFLASILLILLGTGVFSLGLLGEFMVSYLEKIWNKQERQDE